MFCCGGKSATQTATTPTAGGPSSGGGIVQVRTSYKGAEYPYNVHVACVAANDPCEDRFFIDPKECLYGVMDGHGGAEIAECCTTMLAKHIRTSLTDSGHTSEEAINNALHDGFMKTDREVLDTYVMQDPHGKMAFIGSCATVSYIHGNTIYLANAGDSRAILGYASDGKPMCKWLSNDHNASNESEQQKVIERSGDENAIRLSPLNMMLGSTAAPKRVAGILLVTRAIGDAYLKQSELGNPTEKSYITAEPEIISHKITDNDLFVVIATDGLWEHVSPEEVVNFIIEHGVDDTVATRLLEVCELLPSIPPWL
eukprot:TRINITY_DN3046_c0_g2_i7.p1 TRINITY_DN3046_c0_g2~~TRINITY_DN3046_c0_g2_i7.p1  ORF type:complete len:313 (+),score=57.00 TRINITY_DN3046_c0_g2_i7:54-992(+)